MFAFSSEPGPPLYEGLSAELGLGMREKLVAGATDLPLQIVKR